MYSIVWRYEVGPAEARAFEAAYGPAGDWARLFRQAPGFRGVELFRGPPGVFLTLDHWDTEAAFQAFQAAHAEAYAALDVRFAPLSRGQTRLGALTG